MRLNGHHHKGKAKELDPEDLLDQLNQLLEALLIPIRLPELTIVTPSLLLAVLESILERRFLDVDDSIRTSKSPHSRSKCLKIMVKALGETLDPDIDRWSPDSVNLAKLYRGDLEELVKLIDGLLKLSKQSNNLAIHDGHKTIPSGPSRQHKPRKRLGNESTFSSTDLPLADNPSMNPLPRASSRASNQNPLSRSINRQRNIENPPPAPLSNPPTLRNLLGPLQALMISSKRPQSPRTAHRVMVNKLRQEGIHDNVKEQILNHDTDGSLSTRIDHEQNSEGSAEESSSCQYVKGTSFMTLEGIEPDDPFVSMETRRAMESQLVLNQTTATFDITNWAVAGNESTTESSRSSRITTMGPFRKERKQGSILPQNDKWSIPYSPTASTSSVTSSNQPVRHSDEPFEEASSGYHSDAKSVKSSSKAHGRVDYRLDGAGVAVDYDRSMDQDYGFGRPEKLNKADSSDDSLPSPHPHSIPLPTSPVQSETHFGTQKVLLASEGAKLELVVSDVIEYERQKERQTEIEGWGWLDIEKLSQESKKLREAPTRTSSASHYSDSHLDLMARKVELLKLLNQAGGQNKSIQELNSRSSKRKTAEDEPIKLEDHRLSTGEENVRIRVTRQPLEYDDRTQEEPDGQYYQNGHGNRLIVLNRLSHHHGLKDSHLGYQSSSRQAGIHGFSFEFDHLDSLDDSQDSHDCSFDDVL